MRGEKMIKIKRSCENRKKYYIDVAEVRFILDFSAKHPFDGWMIP